MMFMDVVTWMSVVASTNDLNQVGAMSGLMDDCGWQPEGLGVIEYREFVLHIAVCSDGHGMQHSGWHGH